ncbi:hypothetical protein LUTEI9C_50140 [Luteimonas sp. 9C]|nr:hypothetical protein LUTEI9C_50140 [Luteimonas sp. 9C]
MCPAGVRRRAADQRIHRPGPVRYRKSSPTKNPASLQGFSLEELAERTGLEPATSGVTGQHSNQLNYRSAL